MFKYIQRLIIYYISTAVKHIAHYNKNCVGERQSLNTACPIASDLLQYVGGTLVSLWGSEKGAPLWSVSNTDKLADIDPAAPQTYTPLCWNHSPPLQHCISAALAMCRVSWFNCCLSPIHTLNHTYSMHIAAASNTIVQLELYGLFSSPLSLQMCFDPEGNDCQRGCQSTESKHLHARVWARTQTYVEYTYT